MVSQNVIENYNDFYISNMIQAILGYLAKNKDDVFMFLT